MKQADTKEMSKEASNSVSISTNAVSPDPLSPTPSTSSATKTPENIEDDPNEQVKEISKWNTPLISCIAQV